MFKKVLNEKKHNIDIGCLGEQIAKEFLEDKGYSILDQNYKNKYAEIDLICQRGNAIVFVEVKTRVNEQFGIPEDAINRDKLRRLVRNAQIYMIRKNYDMDFRIDAVCIVLNEDKQPIRVDHYENINI